MNTFEDDTALRIHLGCKPEVSFKSLAKSCTSRSAIVAGSGITSADRIGVLMKSADGIGIKGVVNLQAGR